MVRRHWWFLGLAFSVSVARADMEDRAYIRETVGVVVTNVYPNGVDLGSKTLNNVLFRIAGIPVDVSGEGTRCGGDVESMEIANDNNMRRIELRTSKGPVSNCPLAERQLKMMLPVAIADNGAPGANIRTMIKLRYRRLNAQGERVYFFKVFRVEYIRNQEGEASVRISDPYHG